MRFPSMKVLSEKVLMFHDSFQERMRCRDNLDNKTDLRLFFSKVQKHKKLQETLYV